MYIIVPVVSPKLLDLGFMGTVSEIKGFFMTKIPVKVVNKCKGSCKGSCREKTCNNIHSINNQEFRFPSLLTRLKNLLFG